MMQALPLKPQSNDQRVVYSSISWRQFKLIQSGFAYSPGIRLAYHDNTIEILMPGREHEMFSRLIGFLIGCATPIAPRLPAVKFQNLSP